MKRKPMMSPRRVLVPAYILGDGRHSFSASVGNASALHPSHSFWPLARIRQQHNALPKAADRRSQVEDPDSGPVVYGTGLDASEGFWG